MPAPPLEKQTIDIPLGKGLEQYVDPHVVAPGSFLVLNNVVCDQSGAWKKRNGYGSLPTGVVGETGAVLNATHLDTVGNELLAVAPNQNDSLPHVFSYTPGANGWNDRSIAPQATVQRSSLIRTYPGVTTATVAVAGNFIVHYWAVNNGGVYRKGFDRVTGATIGPGDDTVEAMPSQLGIDVAAFNCGTVSIAVYYNAVSNILRAEAFDTGVFSVSHYNLVSGGNSYLFDACGLDATRFVVVYVDRSAYTTLNVKIFSAATFAVLASTTVVFGTQIKHVSVTASAGTGAANGIFIAFSDLTGAGSAAYNLNVVGLLDVTLGVKFAATNSLTGINSITDVCAAIGPGGGVTDIYAFYSGNKTAADATLTIFGTYGQAHSLSGSTRGPQVIAYNCQLYARPFVYGGRLFGVLTEWGQGAAGGLPLENAVLALLDVGGATPFSPAVPLLQGVLLRYVAGYGATQNGGGRRSVAQIDANNFVFDQMIQTQVRSSAGFGSDTLTLRMGAPQPALMSSGVANNDLLWGGALTSVYDSQALVESGFLHGPEPAGAAVISGNGSGGQLGAGTYNYVATWEWTDAHGQLHQSELSPVIAATVAGTSVSNQVTLNFKNLSMTSRGGVGAGGAGGSTSHDGVYRDVTLAIFRTQANQAKPYYRISPKSALPNNPLLVLNHRDQGSVSFLDTYTDTQLTNIGLGFSYTDGLSGSLLQSVGAPPSNAVVVHKNRLWLASAEDTKAVWHSKLFVPGEFPGWNDALTVRVDDAPDGVTALASLDASLVIFTPSRVYLVEGDGPNDTGFGGQFLGPNMLTSEAGCVDPRSVAVFSGGVVFQGRAGFYLLDRSRTLTYLGTHVQQLFLTYPTVLGVQVDAVRQRIYWLCDGGSIGHKTIVYDYGHDVWHTWDVNETGNNGAKTSALWQGRHVVADLSGIELESYGTQPACDPLGYVSSFITTPWIRVGAVGGFQRVWRVVLTGTQVAAHSLAIAVYNDYDDTNLTEFFVFDLTGTSTVLGLPNLRLSFSPKVQKCSAMKIAITDLGSPNGLPKNGFVLAGISLEIAVKKGSAKLSSLNRG